MRPAAQPRIPVRTLAITCLAIMLVAPAVIPLSAAFSQGDGTAAQRATPLSRAEDPDVRAAVDAAVKEFFDENIPYAFRLTTRQEREDAIETVADGVYPYVEILVNGGYVGGTRTPGLRDVGIQTPPALAREATKDALRGAVAAFELCLNDATSPDPARTQQDAGNAVRMATLGTTSAMEDPTCLIGLTQFVNAHSGIARFETGKAANVILHDDTDDDGEIGTQLEEPVHAAAQAYGYYAKPYASLVAQTQEHYLGLVKDGQQFTVVFKAVEQLLKELAIQTLRFRQEQWEAMQAWCVNVHHLFNDPYSYDATNIGNPDCSPGQAGGNGGGVQTASQASGPATATFTPGARGAEDDDVSASHLPYCYDTQHGDPWWFRGESMKPSFKHGPGQIAYESSTGNPLMVNSSAYGSVWHWQKGDDKDKCELKAYCPPVAGIGAVFTGMTTTKVHANTPPSHNYLVWTLSMVTSQMSGYGGETAAWLEVRYDGVLLPEPWRFERPLYCWAKVKNPTFWVYRWDEKVTFGEPQNIVHPPKYDNRYDEAKATLAKTAVEGALSGLKGVTTLPGGVATAWAGTFLGKWGWKKLVDRAEGMYEIANYDVGVAFKYDKGGTRTTGYGYELKVFPADNLRTTCENPCTTQVSASGLVDVELRLRARHPWTYDGDDWDKTRSHEWSYNGIIPLKFEFV